MSEKPIQWMTTLPNPYVISHSENDGQRGWRLHAVRADDSETGDDVKHRRSLCGILPGHGWGLDLFIDRSCVRCLVAAGLACTACKGRGRGPKPLRTPCEVCNSSGEASRIAVQRGSGLPIRHAS